MNKTHPDKRNNLLDELDNLRGLLGDEATDVHLDDLPLLDNDAADSDGQLPLLQTEPKPAPATKAAPAADAKRQEPPNERVNPFLKSASDAIAAKQAARNSTPPASTTVAKSAPLMSESQIGKLVDKVVEECLPHIEQTLRVHLTAALHRQNRNT